MTPGQTRVFVLILVLLALEIVRSTSVKGFVQGAVNQWVTALNASASKKAGG